MLYKDKMIYIVMLIVLGFFAYMGYRYMDIQFLPATGGDESVQFYQLLNMYEGFRHFDIEKIFRFEFYNYGFVWYLLNLLVVAPFHILHNDSIAIFAPRVLNGVFSVLCLWMVYKISRLYLSGLYSYGIVLFVLLMPGFYAEGYLFKPDVFQAFFLLCSVYLLALDNFSFGRKYYFSIVVFGLAVGVAKFQAVMFFPMIFAYAFVPFFSSFGFKGFKKSFNRCVFSFLMVAFVWILTNPYLLHPRGFLAWWEMFVFNMHSNATNHGHYNHISLAQKIFSVVDFYFFEIFVFAILVVFCLILFWRFFYLSVKKESFDKSIFVCVGIGFFVSLIYLLFMVNKAWSNYYLSTIYLGVLLFIPLFELKNIKWILPLLLAIQVGGGGINGSYKQVFKKYNQDLSQFYAQSDELLRVLSPIVKKMREEGKDTIVILTDTPSFEYKKLDLKGRDIYQTFGELIPSMFSLKEFMKKSNSKNKDYFIPKDIIILSKKNPIVLGDFREYSMEFIKTFKDLQQNKYNYIEMPSSQDFVIFVKKQ